MYDSREANSSPRRCLFFLIVKVCSDSISSLICMCLAYSSSDSMIRWRIQRSPLSTMCLSSLSSFSLSSLSLSSSSIIDWFPLQSTLSSLSHFYPLTLSFSIPFHCPSPSLHFPSLSLPPLISSTRLSSLRYILSLSLFSIPFIVPFQYRLCFSRCNLQTKSIRLIDPIHIVILPSISHNQSIDNSAPSSQYAEQPSSQSHYADHRIPYTKGSSITHTNQFPSRPVATTPNQVYCRLR